MITMPSWVHCLRMFSRSIMFVLAKYNTGVRFFSDATSLMLVIGDLICLPVANQNSSSHTQKSSSMCVAMTCLSVIIKSSWVSNDLPIELRCSAIGFVGAVSEVSPNVTSEKVGAVI